MSTCNTLCPPDATPEERERWRVGVEVMANALEHLKVLGLRIHTAYHEDFFMEFSKRDTKP